MTQCVERLLQFNVKNISQEINVRKIMFYVNLIDIKRYFILKCSTNTFMVLC